MPPSAAAGACAPRWPTAVALGTLDHCALWLGEVPGKRGMRRDGRKDRTRSAPAAAYRFAPLCPSAGSSLHDAPRMTRSASPPGSAAASVSPRRAHSASRRSALRGAAGTMLAGMALPGALLAVGGSSHADNSPALRYGNSAKALRLAERLARQTALPVAWLRE